ncbi:MAG TPA: insulinase family protein, partial [Polyangiaceae bacterium]|nr:insulinase family protein [Polyangiaceae bacterium]
MAAPDAPSAPDPLAAPGSPALALDPRIQTGKLANGLTYYLQQHAAKDQRANVFLVVKAGSLHEADDQRGLAHFVEHLAFSGTSRFEKQKLVDFFEKSGLRWGADANAKTDYDRTQYQLSVPTDDPQLLLTALDVLEDWASGFTFSPDEVEKERQVLLSEWTSSQGARRRVGEQQREFLLGGSRYVAREVLGDKAVLEKAPLQRIQDYYRTWYRPERMAVVVVGDIDPSATRAAIEERFSRVAAAQSAPPAEPSFSVPVRRTAGATVISDPEAQAATVNVLFKSLARPVRSEGDYRVQLLTVMSTLMLSHRLEVLAAEAGAPFAGASSSLAPGVFGRLDLYQVSAHAKGAQINASLGVLLDEVERVRRHGFIAAEFERSKAEYARFLDQAVAAQANIDGSAIASALANHFVTGNVVTAPELQKTLGTRCLAEASAADVSAVVKAWLSASEQLLLVSGSSRDSLPDRRTLLGSLVALRERQLDPYTEEGRPAALLDPLPTPGQIVKEASIDEVGLTVWTLSNGARVVLKPTDFKAEQILEQSISFGGNARVPAGDFPSARAAHEIVSASGLGAFDRQTLNKLLVGKVVSAYPWIDEQSQGIHASAAPRDAETMLQLIYLFATAPRRDEAAFERYRAALRERLRRDRSPDQALSDAVTKKLWGNEPRRSTPTLTSVDEMQLDKALDFYKQRFADQSNVTFVFVGKLDLPSFRPLVERYLASLPGGGRKETYKDLGLHRTKGISKVRVQQGPADRASVTLLYYGESPWSEKAHTDLYMLEQYLSIRLQEVLREQLGLAVTPYVGSTFERIPFGSYSLAIAFECKPADVDKLVQGTRDVIAELKKSGAEARYVEALVSQRTRQLEESYRSNEFWLDRLVDKYKLGEDPREILALPELTQRVTSDNLRLTARKFLRDVVPVA